MGKVFKTMIFTQKFLKNLYLDIFKNLYNNGNRLHCVCEYLRICYDYLLWVLSVRLHCNTLSYFNLIKLFGVVRWD